MRINHNYDNICNVHWYHVRQSNDPIYKHFYNWLNGGEKKIHYDYTSWPDHCFVFLYEPDRCKMHEIFSDYIGELELEEFDRENYYDLSL